MIKVDSRLVVVPVSVVDPAGEPVLGLGLEDFRVSEDGRQQILESVGTAEQVPLEIGLWLIGALMLRTASMYVFSAAVTAVARIVGGTGSWKENRAGIFWGALVAAPFGFLMAVVTVSMSWLEPYFPVIREDWIALPPYWISLVPFIWFISQGVAEVNGYKKNAICFLVMSAMALAGLVVAMYLRVAGII